MDTSFHVISGHIAPWAYPSKVPALVHGHIRPQAHQSMDTSIHRHNHP